MRVRLLGNLHVVVDGTAGVISGAGERALLALLALNAGRVVSADGLVDALWGERLPANPGNALQTRVSKLRRVLASLGADSSAVATVPHGYRLDIEPSQVDARQFEHDLALGRAATDRGDTDEAYRRYTAALALWRGAALADFPEDTWASAEAVRLNGLRLAALAERIDLDLAAGRHAGVVSELEALVVEHPLREGLHAQLMLALYRSGRQADALAAYQRARDTLDSELGLDPSGELRRLEAAILRQDPALAPPARAPQRRRTGGNIPARVASFVGRDHDVEELVELMDAERLLTITGPGGAGKTTVALETARRVVERFDDGVWFVDLSGATAPAHVPAVIAATLMLPATDAAAGEAGDVSLARQLHNHRCMIVLDNCEHLVEACAVLVEQVLIRCPGLRILATSREALAVPGEVQYALAPLPLDAAVDLFVHRARAVSRTFSLDGSSADHVQDICARLDGMPLAIELAAARVKVLPVEEIAARLADRFKLLTGGSRTAQARHQTLRATVDWSYQLLPDEARLVLRRLSVLVGGWSMAVAEEVCAGDDLDRDAVFDLVGRLVDRSLVVADGGSFRLLETIRDFAADLLTECGEAGVVTRRNVERLLRLAEDTEAQLRGADEVVAIRQLADEHDGLRSALAWCADNDPALGQRLAGALSWFWQLGDHEEGRRYVERLLQATDTDAYSRGRVLQALSIVGRPSAVILHPDERCAAAARESAELLEQAGDTTGAAFSKALLAVEGVAGRDVNGCYGLLDAAGAAAGDDAWLQAFVDYVRMKVMFRWGDPDTAIALGDRAAEIFSRLGSAWGVGSVRAHQGYDLRILGRLDEALAADVKSLETYRTAGLLNNTQMLYGDTGITRVFLGDEEGARADFAAAAEMCRRYGYRSGEGMAETGYGYLARMRGDDAGARDHFTTAVRILTDVGFLTVLAVAQSGLGHTLGVLGDADGAERAHRAVLDISRSVHESWLLALALEGLAGVELLRCNGAQAAELLETAAAVRVDRCRPVDPVTRLDVERIAAGIHAGVR